VEGKIRRVFPGGNTSRGFYSYYDYIIEEDANRIFVIKGGPGTGKSSLMKKVAKELIEKGYDIEFHHCSSDNNSIDGIVVPKLRIAMIDGTAPHVVDPKNPGGVDEIIHLGDYWDLEKMEVNKQEILRVNKEVGRLFRRAYRFLKAALPIYEDIVVKYSEAMDFGKVNILTYNLINQTFEEIPVSNVTGKARHLFGSAYTPNGWVEYTDTILQDAEKVYYINGDIGTGKSTLLEKIYKEATISGLDVEVYHTPLIPEKIETIYIKELNIGLTTSKMFKDNNFKTIDLDSYLDKDMVKKYEEELQYDKKLLNILLDNAILNINRAKKNHDILETYYVPNMDFNEINKVKDKIIERILKYDINKAEA
jgi:hypothetical protein